MVSFKDALIQLEGMGLLDVLLPFLLIFTICFAVLQKSKILGPNSKNFNVIVSFSISLAAVIPHVLYPGSPTDVVAIMNKALPSVSLLMIASMMVLLLIGVFGENVNIGNTSLAGIVVLFSIVAVAYSFIAAAGVANVPPWLNWMVDEETRGMLIAILVFGLIVWFITKEETNEQVDMGKGIKEMLGGLGKVYHPNDHKR
jgi:hypothetical protein